MSDTAGPAPSHNGAWLRPQVVELSADEAAEVRRRFENLDAALALAAAGLPVFPAAIERRLDGTWSKRPLVSGWQQRATTDAGQIRRWWQPLPDAAPGIELGCAGLIVIDADRHGGPDGVAALERLAIEHGGLPLGPVTETPTGGRHFIYGQPEGEALGNRRGALPPGIDVRGAGGWIVAPGAVRPDGGHWAPAADTPSVADAYRAGTIPLIPDWLVAIIRTTPERPPPDRPPPAASGARQSTSSLEREVIYARQALRSIADEIRRKPPGSRNEALNKGAFRMGGMVARGWIDQSDVVDQLSEAAIASGLDVDEVQRTLASGLTAGLQQPAEDLEDRPRSHVAGRVAPQQSDCDAADVRPWPELPPAALRGLAGEVARVATAHSEADPVAVNLTFLTGAGALMGRARYVRVGDTEHHARLMSALVGATSRARKGTSWTPVRRLLQRAEEVIQAQSTLPHPLGLRLRITHGPLSSGEGLVAAIRDAMGDDDAGGTDDKRLLVVEGELGAALRAMQRQGNTLSMILRTAWDGHELAPLIKRDRMIATDPHICVVAHITRQELRELLSASDVWGGLANRLLWACVRRRTRLPSPQPISDQDLDRLAAELARVAIYAHGRPTELRMTNSATAHWSAVYPELTQDRPGLLGAATARAEAQTLRLALTYALIDGADRIEFEHLEAALAMWRYADDSAAYLFGGVDLDPIAQTITEALRRGALSQSEIRDLFGRHQPAARLADVLRDLQEHGRITLTEEQTGGRPRRIWSLTA